MVAKHIPYIRNRSQKKIFTDFVNLGAFANIFLHYFLYQSHFPVVITKFANVFREHCDNRHRKSFLLQMISDIRYYFIRCIAFYCI